MASATIISTMEPSSISPSLVSHWATLLQQQLCLVEPYDDLQDDFLPASITVDESILEAPRRRAADPEAAALAKEIAKAMYPDLGDSLGPIIRYEKDVVKLRRLVILQRKRTIDAAVKRREATTWAPRIIEQGAWDPITDPVSLDGAPALPMPVQIAEPETLAPFFEHLAHGGTEEKSSSPRGIEEGLEVEEPSYGIKTLEFEKGVVYSDRRMDLCKMVLGPTNIGDLIESLKTNTFITHFLLGNNIIGPHGAKCIAEFLESYPNRMDTWYLAGNCIDGASFKLLVDGWVKSTSTTNIWLKRNPLGPASAHQVFRLITEASNLRTLDLDQTELGDVGVAELFTKLAKYADENPLPLRHIYLNAAGIGTNGAAAIAQFLSARLCGLDSLYMTNNPLGNDGLKALAIGLQKNKSLTRLTVASVGGSDKGIIALCESLEKHPGLTMLDIGQSFATPDLGMRYNWVTDRSAFAVLNLIICSSKLTYLNLGQCGLTHMGLNTILEGIIESRTLLYYFTKTVWPQEKSPAAVSAGQKYSKWSTEANNVLAANVARKYGKDKTYNDFLSDEKRWLVNDMEDVRKIDSVYRNRDAGLARRGLKILDKWWDDEDETLKEVMSGAVGPICTRKKKVEGAVGPVCTMRKARHTVAA